MCNNDLICSNFRIDSRECFQIDFVWSIIDFLDYSVSFHIADLYFPFINVHGNMISLLRQKNIFFGRDF